MAHRRRKLATLRATPQAFPNDFRRSRSADGVEHDAATVGLELLGLDKAGVAARQMRVQLAGRLIHRRGPFMDIRDGSGDIQFYLARKAPEALRSVVEAWDIGDIVCGGGIVTRSDRGALYVDLQSARLLTKSLRPLPDALVDHEMRYRRRYADLIINRETRRVFEVRSRVIEAFRDFLRTHRYMEVETPMMLAVSSGASAKPFVTHHHALDMELYLRVAPELNLKRLVVGGFERVFEINRNFRNEGLSPKHNPEFTMLEFYQAYADYRDLMDFTEQMLRYVAQAACGTTQVSYQGVTFDLAAPIPRLSVGEMLIERAGLTAADLADRQALVQRALAAGVDVDAHAGLGKLQFDLFEALVEPYITAPVFLTRYPIEVSPLARRNDDDPDVTDRFELFMCGREIANGFSELNDAEDQAARFEAQAQRRRQGDEDTMQYDADYITALEYGLPPTAGEGVGIDRFVMLLTDQPHIRDVLLFPHMRPQRAPSADGAASSDGTPSPGGAAADNTTA